MRSFERDHFQSLRRLSDAVARLFDTIYLTPNIVTWTGLVLTFPMLWAFLTGRLVLGTIIFCISASTDFIDGALARYQDAQMSDQDRVVQQSKPFLFRRGKTEYGILSGAAIDPLADKLRYFLAVIPLGWETLWRLPMIAAITLAIILTILRAVYNKGKANIFGKYKAHVEIIAVLLLILYTFNVPHLYLATNVVLVLATSLGALSLIGQAYTYFKRLK